MPTRKFYRRVVKVGDDVHEMLLTELEPGESANKVLREFLMKRRLKRADVHAGIATKPAKARKRLRA